MDRTKVWLISGNLVALLCCVGLFVWVYDLNQEIKSLEFSARMLKTEIGSKKSGTGADAIWDVFSVWDSVYMLRNSMARNDRVGPMELDTSAQKIKISELEIEQRQLKMDLGFFEPTSGLSGGVRVNCFMNREGQISCRAPH